MSHSSCKILLKSDVICPSYKKVHRGVTFFPDTMYICSHVRSQSHKRQQLTVCKRAENLDRQTAAGHECACASHKRHTIIRPRSDGISARRSTLAGRPTTCHVQAVSAGVQVFARLGTAVSCRTMCASLRRHGALQPPLCHSKTTKFSSIQHG